MTNGVRMMNEYAWKIRRDVCLNNNRVCDIFPISATVTVHCQGTVLFNGLTPSSVHLPKTRGLVLWGNFIHSLVRKWIHEIRFCFARVL